MNNLIPEKNISYAYLAGSITALLVHVAAKLGYSVSPDVSDALTGIGAVLVGHLVDILQAQVQNGRQDSSVSGKTGQNDEKTS